tara:strand:+ start:553 stop:1461 length:909 start_codon:yes stop_codon:yes gene_type:complete
MIENITKSVVFPLVPAYNKNQDVNYASTLNYIEHLQALNASTLMTTAGTTQFHLLTNKEVLKLNTMCADEFGGTTIAGLKPNSFRETKEQIKEHNANLKGKNACLMLLYPERYYDNESIIRYFKDLADISKFPVLIHGMFMRKGTGGTYNFKADLVNELATHPNIIGMKEETNNLMDAYQFCKDVDTDNFGIIVAGGSQKRFSFLHSAGAQTFLSGVGSLFPSTDNLYHMLLKRGLYDDASKIKEDYENELFDVFMKIGWHLSLRTALKELNLISEYDRMPFIQPTKQQREMIIEVVSRITE